MSEPIRDIGNRLELFVDRFLIDRLTDCRLQLARPRHAGVAVRFDNPWEGLFGGVITVIRDDDRYRMYWRGMPVDRPDGSDTECTCYAESADGVTWSKPMLDLHKFPGHDRTNIIIHGQPPASHNFTPFLDTRPGVPEGERFKAIAGLHHTGLFAYVSADGIRWRRMREQPIVTSKPFAFDSQNVAFWSHHEGRYVLYYRTWKPKDAQSEGYRWVSRVESDDFATWSQPVEMQSEPPNRDEQIYTQGTHPYFRAPHLYVALAARFMPDKQVLTDTQARELGVAEGYYGDVSDVVLMTSRDGQKYDRTFLESFLRPGPGLRHWVSRTNYAGLGIVPTGEGEMSFYAHREYAQASCHAARYTLRTDGFASVNAPHAGGEMVTHPLTFRGRELVLNYETSAFGWIRVELQETDGRAIPGFTLEDAPERAGDEIEGAYRWKSGGDVSELAGKPVRLRFVMRDADVYALRFR